MRPTQMKIPGLGLLAAGASLTILLAAGACSSSSTTTSSTTSKPTTSVTPASSTSSTTPASSAICAQKDQLKKSLTALQNVNVVQTGVNGLQTAFQAVQTDAQALATSAKQAYGPEVTAFSDALGSLKASIANFSSGGVGPVVSALTLVQQTGNALITDIQKGC